MLHTAVSPNINISSEHAQCRVWQLEFRFWFRNYALVQGSLSPWGPVLDVFSHLWGYAT